MQTISETKIYLCFPRLALGPTDENGVPALNGEGAVDPSLAGSSSNQKEGSGSSSEEEDENGEMRAKGYSFLKARHESEVHLMQNVKGSRVRRAQRNQKKIMK